MSTREWNTLLRALENQLCVLLVGPAAVGSVQSGAFEPYTDQLARQIASELEKENTPFDPDHAENLAYVAQTYNSGANATELDAAYIAQSFYQKQVQPSPALAALAKLPFSLVVNTTPDDLMAQAFRQSGKFGTMQGFYNYRRPVKFDYEKTSTDKPLVYNLFGHYQTPESLVLTTSNQLDFIGKVMRGDPPLPPKLMQEFDDTKTYLFVGFDWRQWHLQLLLRTLKFSKDSTIVSPTFQEYSLSRMAREIYKSLFNKFTFADEPIDDFVANLAQHFENQGATPAAPASGKRIFISGHPADEAMKTALANHLRPLERTGLAICWHEGKAALGEDLGVAVQRELSAASVILLLVSAEYLADDNLRNTQLLPALARQGDAKVVPVILEPCTWQMLPELTQCHPILPNPGTEPGKPIATWPNADEAYASVVAAVNSLIV